VLIDWLIAIGISSGTGIRVQLFHDKLKWEALSGQAQSLVWYIDLFDFSAHITSIGRIRKIIENLLSIPGSRLICWPPFPGKPSSSRQELSQNASARLPISAR
jgi:hypothetical protein